MKDNSDMIKQDSPYWIDVTMESEEAGERVRLAFNACQRVHAWTITEMRDRWQGCPIKSSDILPDMTRYIEKGGLKKKAQRFSFVTTVNRAVARFHTELTVEKREDEDKNIWVRFPNTPPPAAYKLLDIQQRSVWKKYMAEHSRFSTHYGSVFLDGEWRKTILYQSLRLGINPSTIPYLIYSATFREIGESWQVHFNFHKPQSRQGKRRIK